MKIRCLIAFGAACAVRRAGQQRWSTVHVADLAEFFRRVLESASVSSRTVEFNPLPTSQGALRQRWAREPVERSARVVEGEVAVGRAVERFDENRRLNDEDLENQVRELAGTLLAETQPQQPARLAA